jgi:transposase
VTELESARNELDRLHGEVEALRQDLEKTSSDREQYRKLYMQLLERCKEAGPRSVWAQLSHGL